MARYDFRNLSPLDFEDLVRDLLQAETNLRFEGFGPGRDLGIDFRFAAAGRLVVVQAKHYAESGFEALLGAAKAERVKVAKIAPQRYFFVTSVSLSPARKAKLQNAFENIALSLSDILGREDLNNLLGRHPHVEQQHFKLWLSSTAVLERILHSGLYNRTQAELEHISVVIPKFVDNESVPKAQAILEQNGALIIAGPPGVGKSTLARMLLWTHAQQNWRVSVIDNINEAFTIVNEGEPRVVFFDDFLGQVRLTLDWLRSVDQRLPPFLQKVRSTKSLRFIMTTRDYILHQAQDHSDRLAGPNVKLSELLLNVGVYTTPIRARILYDHLYFSDLGPDNVNFLLDDDFYLSIIKHRNFSPRIIEQITSTDFVSSLGEPLRAAVTSILENPEMLWEKPYRSHISDDGRALAVALFFNSTLVELSDLENAFVRVSGALGRPVLRGDISSKFRAALRELEGSFLSIAGRRASFSNPGVRDFLQLAAQKDNILPLILNIAEHVSELTQLWQVWNAQKPDKDQRRALQESWIEASHRVLAVEGHRSLLVHLHLIVELCERFESEASQSLLESALAALADCELEYEDADDLRSLLELLGLSVLSQELNERMAAVATTVGGVRPPERIVTEPSGRVEIALRGSVLAR